MTFTPRQTLVRRLTELGYFDDAPPLAMDSLLDLSYHHDPDEADEEPLYDRRTGRAVTVDAEDLAEGYADQIALELAPHLSSRGVQVTEARLSPGGSDYCLMINGRSHRLGSRNSKDWRRVAIRFAAVISELLEEAGSSDRAYLVYLGHQTLLLLLTPAMFEAIVASPAVHLMFKPLDPSAPLAAGPSIWARLRFVFKIIGMMVRR